MPYADWFAARVRDPKSFDKFTVKRAGDGIMLVLGWNGDRSEVQSYRFAANRWTMDEVKAWLRDHKIKPLLVEEPAKVQAFEVRLQCFTDVLSPEEIRRMVPQDVKDRIRAKDPNPLYRAYSICHEGVSSPKVLGVGRRKISWPRRAVESIQAFAKRFMSFFRGHNADNSTYGREELGKVVAHGQKEINGKLHHVVVGYFPNKEKIRDLVVPSMEAVWNFVEKGDSMVAQGLKELTAIALAKADEETPAFPDAGLLGAIQAFDEKDVEEKLEEELPAKRRGEKHMITFEEVKEAIRELNIWPHQVFSVEKLKSDNEFGRLFTDGETRLQGVTKERDELKKAFEELDKKNRDLTLNLNRVTVKDKVQAVVEAKKLTDKEKAFLQVHLDALSDFTDQGIEKFVIAQQEDFKKVAPILSSEDSSKKPASSESLGEENPWLKTENKE